MRNITGNKNTERNNRPKMEVHQSWWAMRGIGDANGEWSVEEKFEQISKAGYTGILGRLPVAEESEKWRKLLDEYELDFSIEAFPADRLSFASVLNEAKQFGVSYVNAQVQDAFVVGEEALQLLSGLIEEANEVQFPLFIETHRGRITQDLLRTVDYVEQIPDLRLTIDLSHYVLAGEMTKPDDQAEHYFNQLLKRTSSIHGRISNGEQIQVDIGPKGEHPMLEKYIKWWTSGMSYWLEQANPGQIMPFVCELGPVPYAITRKNYTAPPQEEISDRWQQGLRLKRIAEQTWKHLINP